MASKAQDHWWPGDSCSSGRNKPSEQTMHVEGYVESISVTQVRGWAYCRDQPQMHLSVAVICGEARIATGLANLHREDLLNAGVGDGDHAFVINFDRAIAESDVADVSVLVDADVLPPYRLTVLARQIRQEDQSTLASSIARDSGTSFQQRAPVFVLGAARSGTSAMAQTLLRCGLFEGHEEGHFFGLLPRLISATNKYYDDNGEETLPARATLLGRIPRLVMEESLKDLFRSTARIVYPKGRWLDKTPSAEMIAAAPLMLQLWPNARFIFIKRRGLDNVASRMRKFPQLTFEQHCRDWTQVMRTWRQIRPQLLTTSIEIEQMDILLNPDKVSTDLASFLEMPAEASTLFAQALRVEQPERTSTNLRKLPSLDEMDWTEDQKTRFEEICMEEMKVYGYRT